MLKSINVTSITLIATVKGPVSISDYRPVSCCTVINKCITKLLCEKLKLVLLSVVSEKLGAFVAGRPILHNVLCQDIIRMYRKGQRQKCCMMKVDIQKAYDDTVCWEFVEDMMKALNFPKQFIHLVMMCVSDVCV